MLLKRSTLFLAAALVLGCGDDPASPQDPDARPPEALSVVRFDPALFPGAQKSVSFWAVRGEDREVELRYRAEDEDDEFLEFEVDDDALLSRPDGTLFAEGDSILITITVDPQGEFLFDFQPSGLRFNPDEPAELEINFRLSDPDANGDGVIDDRDRQFLDGVGLWQQETAQTDFQRLLSVRVREDELRAEVLGFTTFAAGN